MPTRPGDGHRQRADRGGLVDHDHDQDQAVSGELVEQLAQSRLGVGQRGVMQSLALTAQRDRVVSLFADVESHEDAEPVAHPSPPPMRWPRPPGLGVGLPASTLRRDQPQAGRPGPYQRSADATRPGDNTPRIIQTTGADSHTGPGGRGSPAGDDQKDLRSPETSSRRFAVMR